MHKKQYEGFITDSLSVLFTKPSNPIVKIYFLQRYNIYFNWQNNCQQSELILVNLLSTRYSFTLYREALFSI